MFIKLLYSYSIHHLLNDKVDCGSLAERLNQGDKLRSFKFDAARSGHNQDENMSIKVA